MTNQYRCHIHKAIRYKELDNFIIEVADYSEIVECKKCKKLNNKRPDKFYREKFDPEKMEKELWDAYVIKEFYKGVKNPDYIELPSLPKEVILFMRATLRLQRLIKVIKKGEFKTKKQIEEEKRAAYEKRLKGVLVYCKKHGPLFLTDVIKGGKSRWTGEQRFKCRQCMKETHRNYYERKKDYVLDKHKKYRINNPEKVKEVKAKSWRKCNGKNKINESIKRKSVASN